MTELKNFWQRPVGCEQLHTRCLLCVPTPRSPTFPMQQQAGHREPSWPLVYFIFPMAHIYHGQAHKSANPFVCTEQVNGQQRLELVSY